MAAKPEDQQTGPSDDSNYVTEIDSARDFGNQSEHHYVSCINTLQLLASCADSCQTSGLPPRSRSKILGPVSWDPAVELSVPGRELDKPHSSTVSHSSIVNDLGNAQYLADNVISSRDSRTSTEQLVLY